MINGLGIVGWGVGGIEAEAGMLGQPVYFLTPDVVGVHLRGALQPGVTATDLVLHITEMLRKAKVVGKFVEFHGEGAASLSVTDRATIGNMAPEYGATMGYFPRRRARPAATSPPPAARDEQVRRRSQLLTGAGNVRHAAEGRHRLQRRCWSWISPTSQPSVAGPEAAAGPHRPRRR